jgi:hypothetical protein
MDMTQLNMESEIKFDYSVGTEDRFAIRRWFRSLVETQNSSDLSVLNTSCAEDLVALGFSEQGLSRAAFLEYMQQIHASKKVVTVRYPSLSVNYNRFLYDIEGVLELFIDGVLSMEGTFESRVRKVGQQFQFAWIKFYPRMIVAIK